MIATIAIPVGSFESDAAVEFTLELEELERDDPELLIDVLDLMRRAKKNPYDPLVVNRAARISRDNRKFYVPVSHAGRSVILEWEIVCHKEYSLLGKDWEILFLAISRP